MVGYMQIFDKQPNDWKDLQNKVAHVLQVCGYKVETPKKFKHLEKLSKLMCMQKIVSLKLFASANTGKAMSHKV